LFEVVFEYVIMHVADEFGHEEVDVLSEELVGGVSEEVRDLLVAVLDDADVVAFTRDDYDGADGVVPVLLFLYFEEQFGLGQAAFHRLDGLLVLLVGLVGVDDHLHEVGEEDQTVDVVRVQLHKVSVECVDAIEFLVDFNPFFEEFALAGFVRFEQFPECEVLVGGLFHE
jgi:hypothetical protein